MSAAATSAQAEKGEAFLDAKSAGPDFAVQGEYEGTIGQDTKIGAHVIALGESKFGIVIYDGGLPGAGWSGKTRVFLNGQTADSVTIVRGTNFEGEIKDGKLAGTAEAGVHYEMKKVERKSPTLGAKPPQGAKVLFDGSSLGGWAKGSLDGDLLVPEASTKDKFKDFTLHIEFRTPFMPKSRGQGRGNSGVYLLDQYECQVLDSFGLEGLDNECGGIYKQSKPSVNMCYPPLSWQTYDIDFQAAKFDESGKKTSNAVVTIKHNGVVIHDKLNLTAPTPGGHQNDEKPGALFMQDHGNPVRFRNIWVVEK